MVLGVGGVFFVSKFSLNFPTDLLRVHIFHFSKCSLFDWDPKQREGMGKREKNSD